MLVSTKGRYALRIMLELAQGEKGAYVPLPKIEKKLLKKECLLMKRG